MELAYSIEPKNKEKAVKAMLRDQNISFKSAVMVAKTLRGKRIVEGIKLLEGVISLQRPLPYTRFQKGIGHRAGSGTKIGKYPEKVAKSYYQLLLNLQSNATYKGLDPEALIITHIQAQKGITRRKRRPKGRWRVWHTQYVHIQAIAKEKKEKK